MGKKKTYTSFVDFTFKCPCGKKVDFGTMRDMNKYEEMHSKYCRFVTIQPNELNERDVIIDNRPPYRPNH